MLYDKTHIPQPVHHYESKPDSTSIACDLDSGNTPVYSGMNCNSNVNDETDHIQTKCKTKEIQIKCCDIFQSSIEKLYKLLSQNGITRLCIDSLSEKEFMDLAVQYKHSVKFVGKNEDTRTATKLYSYTEYDIRHLILDGNKSKHNALYKGPL